MNFGAIRTFVFFGGGPILRGVLVEARKWHEDVFVVTTPWQANEKDGSDALEDFLKSHNIKYIVTEDINDPRVVALSGPATCGVSVSACWIFNKTHIDRYEGRLINIHGTPLPRYAGGGGSSWNILQKSREGGGTVHLIDGGIDTGAVLKSVTFTYPRTCRIPNDFIRYSLPRHITLLINVLSNIRAQKTLMLKKQDPRKSTYWPRLATDKQGFIDWSWDVRDIESFVCAFDNPYSGASTYSGDDKVRVRHVRVEKTKDTFHPFQWGLIYRIHAHEYFVACKGGTLIVKNILDDTGQKLKKALKLGDRLYTPGHQLDAAKKYRATYTPKGLKR